MHPQNLTYLISFNVLEIPARTLAEGDSISIGAGANNVVSIIDKELAREHAIFSVVDGVISLKNLAEIGQTIYAGEPLLKGKNYILDDADTIKLGKLRVTIQINPTVANPSHITDIVSPQEIKKKAQPQPVLRTKNLPASNMETTGTMELSQYGAHDLLPIENTPNNEQLILQKEQDHSVDGLIKSILNNPDPTPEKLAKLKPIDATKNHRKIGLQNKIMAPPLYWRIYACLVEISLVYALYYYFLPTLNLPLERWLITLQNTAQGQLPMLDKVLQTSWWQTTFCVFSIYVLLQIITNLIFANSIALKLLTQQPFATFLKSRVQAVLKAILNSLTLPFLIFHLPLLLRRRPFSEWVTKVHLERKIGTQIFLIQAIILPLIMCISFNLGILLTAQQSTQFSADKVNPNNGETQVSEHKTHSAYFAFNLENNPNQILTIIPSIELGQQPPQFSSDFYHTINNTHMRLSLLPPLDFINLLALAKTGNPLFWFFYPNLAKCIEENKIYQDQDTQNELKKLFKSAFPLNIKTFPQILLSNGPFTWGLLKFREEFMHNLKLDYLPKARFITLGQKNFLQLTPAKRKSDKWAHFMPLDFSQMPIYAIAYNSASKAFANKVLFSFLGKGQWNWQKRRENSAQTTAEFANIPTTQYDAFTIIDLFNSLGDLVEINQKIGTKIYNYYYYLSKKTLQKDQASMRPHIENALAQAINFLTQLNNQTANPIIVTLKARLAELQQVLQTDQLIFFE